MATGVARILHNGRILPGDGTGVVSGAGWLGASRAGLLTGVAPVAAAAAGVLLGAPAPRPLVWAGIAVVAAGLALGLLGRT